MWLSIVIEQMRFGRNLLTIFHGANGTVTSCRTRFPDGVFLDAEPEDNDAYRETAANCGYGSDTTRLCVEHEATHSWLASALGLVHSPALYGAATKQTTGPDLLAAEEAAVLAIQHYANLVGIDLLSAIRVHAD